MLKSIETALKLSDIRQKLNDLNTVTDPTDAQNTEERSLLAELKTTEVEYRDALTSEDDQQAHPADTTIDAETREYRQLLARGNVGRVLEAAIERRSALDGAENEIQQHNGLAPNQIPLALLRVDRPLETRSVTPAPTNTGASEQPVLMPIFAQGIGAFLGIDRPTVPAGDLVFPVLTNRPTVGGPHADSTEVDDTTGSFTSDLLPPSRVQASFTYRPTDAARFSQMDSSLRMALNSGLEEKLDYELVAGASGLLAGTNLTNHAASAVTDFAGYVSQFVHARVDGRYAGSQSELRIVAGSATYAHMGSVYRSDNADYTALDAIEKKTGGVRVSAHTPAASGNKQNAVIRMGSHGREMVQAIWDAITLVPDETSQVKKGEIVLTAIALEATKLVRADSFYKQETKHA